MCGVTYTGATKNYIKVDTERENKVNKMQGTQVLLLYGRTQLVDDFGIKYRNKKDAYHLIASLQEKHEVTQYWTGGLYSGIILKWNYITIQLDIPMSGYVKYTFNKFQHPTPNIQQNSPHQWTSPNYRSTVPKMAHPTDESLAINTDESINIQ